MKIITIAGALAAGAVPSPALRPELEERRMPDVAGARFVLTLPAMLGGTHPSRAKALKAWRSAPESLRRAFQDALAQARTWRIARPSLDSALSASRRSRSASSPS